MYIEFTIAMVCFIIAIVFVCRPPRRQTTDEQRKLTALKSLYEKRD